MSLRGRLAAAIILALLLSFGFGAGVATWQAARSVRTELRAAQLGAQETASAALAVLNGSEAGTSKPDISDEGAARARIDDTKLQRIVDAFEGNRHIRAELLDHAGRVVAGSHPASGGVAPQWFLSAVAPKLQAVALPAGNFTLVLSADPTNEGFERWSELREEVALLAMFSMMACILCSVTAARALHPLTDLSNGLSRLGQGERNVRLNINGPPEIAVLGEGFNRLSGALQTAREQNRQLQMQATMLADEERAEIARDLHDEVGPLLFAITAFTATIGRLAAEGDFSGIASQLQSIQEATSAIQREVRDMLGRLHDAAPAHESLADSLLELIAFWRKVQPDTEFVLHTPGDERSLAAPLSETLFRVAQEGMSNAVRHGRPRHVAIRLEQDRSAVSLTVSDDGEGGAEAAGFGLTGMRARIAALGGRLLIVRGAGWVVTATLPLALPDEGEMRTAGEVTS